MYSGTHLLLEHFAEILKEMFLSRTGKVSSDVAITLSRTRCIVHQDLHLNKLSSTDFNPT